MSDKLVSVTDQNLLQSGIVQSLHRLQAPLWIDGQNVVFEDGAVRKSPGYVKVYTPPGTLPITGLQDVLVGLAPVLYAGDAENLYRFDGDIVVTDGSGYTGNLVRDAFQHSAFQFSAFQQSSTTVATLWSMIDWFTWCIATNNAEPPQVNKSNGAGFVDLANAPTRAKIVKRFKSFVVFFNTINGGNYAEWSDIDDAETYPDENFLQIDDLDSEIMAVVEIGDALAIYSNNTLALFAYIGPDLYFAAKRVLTGIGAVGLNAIISAGSLNFGISKQGIWETDAASYVYISPPYIRKWIQDHVNFGAADKIAGYLNEDRNLCEWGVPVDGASENNMTIGYNKANKTWTFRNYGITCGIKKNYFQFPIFGMSSGGVFYGEYGVDADDSPLEAWLLSKPMPGEDQLTWKDVESLLAYIRDLAGSGVLVYLGVQDSIDDAILWSDGIVAQEKTQLQYIDPPLSGKYISIKLYSNSLGDNWKLAGFDIYGVTTGRDV